MEQNFGQFTDRFYIVFVFSNMLLIAQPMGFQFQSLERDFVVGRGGRGGDLVGVGRGSDLWGTHLTPTCSTVKIKMMVIKLPSSW